MYQAPSHRYGKRNDLGMTIEENGRKKEKEN